MSSAEIACTRTPAAGAPPASRTTPVITRRSGSRVASSASTPRPFAMVMLAWWVSVMVQGRTACGLAKRDTKPDSSTPLRRLPRGSEYA